MHRSPLCMLVLGAALAACSTHDDPRSGKLLSNDSTLVARLDADRDTRPAQEPEACRTIVAATPAVVNKPQADTLARKAYDAEILGNVQEAKTLLLRASALDGTNKTTVYHLGRTSEALGDRRAAISAYCRYLALAPTPNESAEARQRVVSLSQTETRTLAHGSAKDSVAASGRQQVVAAKPATTQSAVIRPAVTRPVRTQRAVTEGAMTQPTTSRRVAARDASRETAREEPRVATRTSRPSSSSATSVEQVGGPVDSTASGGEVVAASAPEATVDQSSRDSRAASRGPSRTQSAGIGAAAGAVIGAATGRGVKGAVIGAAAGGILGTVMGGMH